MLYYYSVSSEKKSLKFVKPLIYYESQKLVLSKKQGGLLKVPAFQDQQEKDFISCIF